MNDDELLEGLAKVLRAEPPPLDRAGAAALARRAVDRSLVDLSLLDGVADALAAEPPPDDRMATDRARAAMRTATEDAGTDAARLEPPPALRARAPRSATLASPWRRRAWSGLAAAATILLFGWWAVSIYRDASQRDASPPVAARALRGGHVVSTVGPTTFEARTTGEDTRVALGEGQALFEVRSLEGRAFVVEAGLAEVTVTGTVFSVARDGGSVAVRVFEGAVRVRRGDDVRVLREGDHVGEAAWSLELLRLGREAARRRFAPAARETRPEPASRRLSSETPAETPAETTTVDTAPPASGAEAEAPSSANAAPARTRPRPPRPVTEVDARRALTEARYQDALDICARALEAAPTDATWWLYRGDALRGAGRPSDAIEAYRGAIRHGDGPERAMAGLSAARVAHGMHRDAEARALLDESGAREPSSPVSAAASRLHDQLAP